MDWTTPADVKAKVQRLWERGRILSSHLAGEAMFPLGLSVRRPNARAMSEQFEEVRQWIRAFDEGSKARVGFGYELQWEEKEHRQLGRNRVPEAVIVPTREDALRLIGKQRQAERFDELAVATLGTRPVLRPWLNKKPLALLENADEWQRILTVLDWFREHPRPGLYLRQLDIPGVDTKFIEARKGLLSELLDIVLPPEAVDASAVRHFETRYGLLSKPPLVRLRVLDSRVRIAGMSDVTAPAAQLAGLALPIRRVFITENEINGLAFPDLPDSAVIFGLGYGVERLAEIAWLREKAIHYWGDIDTHGFGILDRLRASFDNARSLMMDRETLLAHRHLWVREGDNERHPGPLRRITPVEQDLFGDLLADRLGDRVRLEQERIGFGWVKRALDAVVAGDELESLSTNPS